uniref:glutaminase n=1 Tax=Angiostrongylus cantonensis TaxID=6313 RepID=A0A0K0DQQ2_ANGCA
MEFQEWIDAGIRKDDPRLQDVINKVREAENDVDQGVFNQEHLFLDKDAFKKCVGNSIGVIGKALKKQLVIPDWLSFTKVMGELYEECRRNDRGQLLSNRRTGWRVTKSSAHITSQSNLPGPLPRLLSVATYIPQLARADPNSFAISVCTVDGQRISWGDALKPFCLQVSLFIFLFNHMKTQRNAHAYSVSKPFTYALVHDELGPDELHSHVGQEPSGRLFNDICLDHNKKPHNPLINAGAIVVASLMKRHASLSDRFDFAIHQMRRFSGAGYVGFNNAVFLSERETADRNYALSYYMREHKDTLDLYFQLCAIETNCDTLAVMAATLANGGVNPMNSERVINNR